MLPNRLIACVCAYVALGGLMSAAAPIDGTFNYQARLTSGGVPITGVVDARFSLWDAAAAGSQIGANIEFLGEAVSDGLYNADLDFGVAALNGDMRWLQVEVKSPAGVGAYVILGRREILAAPYALYALNALNSSGGGLWDANGNDISNNNTGNVGIGTTTPSSRLHVELDATTNFGSAIFGKDTSFTSISFGVHGESTSTFGRAVFGEATAATGQTNGGWFESESTDGRGVIGWATAGVGNTEGVYGQSNSVSGRGVYGFATASTGTTYGVYGRTSSTSGRAVYGLAAGSSGQTYGGYFQSSSTTGRGVYGLAAGSSGQNYGGYFQSASTSGRGVFGHATASSGLTDGVFGLSDSTSGRGIDGWASATTGTTYGVVGQSDSTSGRGVYGIANANSGVNYGVLGRSDSPTGFDFFASGTGTNYGASSSRRWKSNVEPISDPLRKLAKLRGVYFNWDKDHGGQHDVGMIAEEVGKVLPEIVNYEENGVDAIGMDYSKMTPLLVEAVNALRAEHGEKIDVLQAENALLRAQLESLTNRFDAMASPEPKSLTSNTGNAR